MTQSKKKFYYYDFDLEIVGKVTEKNALSVSFAQNININSPIIKPLYNFSDYFAELFSTENYTTFYETNSEILDNIIMFYPYVFFDGSNYNSRYFMVSNDYELYELNVSTFAFEKLDIMFSSLPTIFEDNSKIYFKTDDKFIYFDGTASAIYVTDIFDLHCQTQYKDYRMFCKTDDKFTLFYNEETEIENLGSDISLYESIKFLSNNGEILSLCVIGGYLYVIQQYAISKVTGSSGTFSITATFPISSKINRNTIGQFDDYVVFCTGNGIYLFDGSNLKNVFEKFTNCIQNGSLSFETEDISAVVFNEKYYLLCNVKNESETIKSIIEMNTITEKCNIYNIGEIEKFYVIKNIKNYELVAITNTSEKYKILKQNLEEENEFEKIIKFNKLIFETHCTKILSELLVDANGEFEITISSNFASKIFKIDGYTFIRNIGLVGDYFEIEIKSENSFQIETICFNILIGE